MISATTSPIILFDGECILCNRFVQFIIKRDKKKTFLFATLQSAIGRETIKNAIDSYKSVPDSVILFHNGTLYFRSSAALNIFRLLGWPWKLLWACIIIPVPFRDWLYNIVARNRYKWFGKRNECMIPNADIADRFLSK